MWTTGIPLAAASFNALRKLAAEPSPDTSAGAATTPHSHFASNMLYPGYIVFPFTYWTLISWHYLNLLYNHVNWYFPRKVELTYIEIYKVLVEEYFIKMLLFLMFWNCYVVLCCFYCK